MKNSARFYFKIEKNEKQTCRVWVQAVQFFLNTRPRDKSRKQSTKHKHNADSMFPTGLISRTRRVGLWGGCNNAQWHLAWERAKQFHTPLPHSCDFSSHCPPSFAWHSFWFTFSFSWRFEAKIFNECNNQCPTTFSGRQSFTTIASAPIPILLPFLSPRGSMPKIVPRKHAFKATCKFLTTKIWPTACKKLC